jgi:hypothetical protein
MTVGALKRSQRDQNSLSVTVFGDNFRRDSVGLVPTGPTTGKLPKTRKCSTLSVPACPDGSNDRLGMDTLKFVTSIANKTLLPSGQAETESEFHSTFCGSFSVVDPVGASPTEISLLKVFDRVFEMRSTSVIAPDNLVDFF